MEVNNPTNCSVISIIDSPCSDILNELTSVYRREDEIPSNMDEICDEVFKFIESDITHPDESSARDSECSTVDVETVDSGKSGIEDNIGNDFNSNLPKSINNCEIKVKRRRKKKKNVIEIATQDQMCFNNAKVPDAAYSLPFDDIQYIDSSGFSTSILAQMLRDDSLSSTACDAAESLMNASSALFETTDNQNETISPPITPKKRLDENSPKIQSVSEGWKWHDRMKEARTKRDRIRRSNVLDPKAVKMMSDWYNKNAAHPYPSNEQKLKFASEGGVTLNQVKSWFNNKRCRCSHTRPRRERKITN